MWDLAALLDELKCENPMARLKKVGQNNNKPGAAAKGGAAEDVYKRQDDDILKGQMKEAPCLYLQIIPQNDRISSVR